MFESRLTIEHVGQMGQGVATDAEGNIYFVPGTLPGDEVLVRYETEKKYRDAELIELIGASADRQESPCTYFPTCGGCDWLNWEYSAQLRAKEEIVRHLLTRNQMEASTFLPIRPADKLSGYRNRIQVRREEGQMGFYKKRSHDVVDVKECWVADPRLNVALTELRKEEGNACGTSKFELYVKPDGSVARVDNRPHAAEGFSQVNDSQNEAIKGIVARHLAQAGSRRVLELFCGNGNLTFAFPELEQVIGLDYSIAAIDSAKKRRDELGLKNVLFLQAPVDRRVPGRLPPDFQKDYDTIVLDPPRQGIEMDFGDLIHDKLRTVIYVSCSPVTFAKDCKALLADFFLEEVQPVDMFPHTRHIELVSRWTRR